ncbi:MAG: hypothetical protein ACRC33_25940, partial [Gemmataceae bacterium]
PEVWTAPRELLDPADLTRVPRQGIGRGYKAGKEEVVGLVTALRLYFRRDHAAEKAACRAKLVAVCGGLAGVPHVAAEIIEPEARRGFARCRVRIDGAVMSGYDFIRALKAGTPSIHPGERELASGAVVLHPFGLQDGDERAIVRRVREIARAG